MSIAQAPTQHVSVLPQEVLEYLRAKEGGAFLDCTLGGGGHTALLLAAHPDNTVVAIDRDPAAVKRAETRFKGLDKRVEIHHADFSELAAVCGMRTFQGMLADLGTSSDQLAESRGFSFSDEAPLDMRMDSRQSKSADTVVNTYTERELFEVLARGGVGKEGRAIVRAIVRARPISHTKALAEVIASAVPVKFRKPGIHPATVPFQAIRIEVNDEFEQLEALLSSAIEVVAASGRLAVISFHSGEDRVVTNTMRQWAQGESAPAWWRGSQKKRQGRAMSEQGSRREKLSSGAPIGRLLTRKAVPPTPEEVERNPRSRSARLRVFEFQ